MSVRAKVSGVPASLVAEAVPVKPVTRDSAAFLLRPDGRIASWNEAAKVMLGYSEEEALGRHFAWFFPVDQVQQGESERILRVAAENGFYQWDGW